MTDHRAATNHTPSAIQLKLYVAGRTPRSESAAARVRQLFEDVLEATYEMTVIDVLELPGLADEDKVIATPTLIKVVPPPVRRIVGDLSDLEQVARWLGIDEIPAATVPAAQDQDGDHL